MRFAALLLAVAACSSSGDSTDGAVTGTIGDQAVVARSVGMFIRDDGAAEIVIADFEDVCAVYAQGTKSNSAHLAVYLGTATPAIGDVFVTDLEAGETSGQEGSVVFSRFGAACKHTTDDHAEQGAVTITETGVDGIGLTATLDSSTATDTASGTFTVGCMIESFGDGCLP